MKIYMCLVIVFLGFLSCTSTTNTETFVTKTTGRYLFNANEVLEVYFIEQELFVKWRGKTAIKPLKLNDSSFYMKELNEKLIFVQNPEIHIALAEKTEHKGKSYQFKKLKAGVKTPTEYLVAKEYKKALAAFLAIQEEDSLNSAIKEYQINKLGYNYKEANEFNNAIEILKINTILYPTSSNCFDSLGAAYLAKKDTVNALINYKKALKINPENRSSLKMVKKIE